MKFMRKIKAWLLILALVLISSGTTNAYFKWLHSAYDRQDRVDKTDDSRTTDKRYTNGLEYFDPGLLERSQGYNEQTGVNNE